MASPFAAYEGRKLRGPDGLTYLVRDGKPVPVGAGAASPDMPPPALAPEAQKAIGDARSSATAASSAVPQLERFMSLNKQEPTGMAYSSVNLPSWLGGANLNPGATIKKLIDPAGGSRIEQMQEITANLIPSRHITPGPMTDADARMYERSLPSVGKFGTSNQPNVEMMKAAQKNAGDYLSFLEDYAKRNGGATTGAAEKWMEYSNANPIWRGDQLNNARLPWRDYLYPDLAKPAQPMSAGQKLSPQDAAKLPPGAKFIGLDGVERIRQ